MQMPSRFVVQEFQLEVNHAAYLVEVSRANGNPNSNDLTSLPEWVFHSRHAIWVVRGNLPLAERAIEGERIKKKLWRDFHAN